MELHLIRTADGYAIVSHRAGPYSFSPTTEHVEFQVSADQMAGLALDYEALNAPPAPDPKKD